MFTSFCQEADEHDPGDTLSQGIAHLLQSRKEGDCADYLLFIRFLRAAQRAFIEADSFLHVDAINSQSSN